MILTEMIASLRTELQDTADPHTWVDDELIRAVEKSVSLMSRLLPKRSIIETSLVRAFTGETLTISSNTGTLSYKPIKVGSVTITGKTLDTDYRINYLTGVVTEIGSLLPDTTYTVAYELDLQMLDISSFLSDYIRIERIEYPAGNSPPTLVTADVWGDFLVFRGSVTLTENEHLRIIYFGRWASPTIGVEGDYSSNLDDAIIIGSTGQALIYKAEKYTQLSASAVADTLTVLNSLGDLTLGDSGLTAPTAPSITDLTAPTLYSFDKPSAPSLPSAPTPPTVPTLSFGAVETALTAIAAEITAAKAHHTSGIAVINAATRGEAVAATYGQYAATIMTGAGHRANEALGRLRQIEESLNKYASEVASFGSDVNRYANEVSGTIGKYREQVQAESTGVSSSATMVAKYEAEVREELLKITKYEGEIRTYQAEVTEYQTKVTAYSAQVTNLVPRAGQMAVLVGNYLDIAGRYLASGQSKINEFLIMLGVKAELPMQKASSEQRG